MMAIVESRPMMEKSRDDGSYFHCKWFRGKQRGRDGSVRVKMGRLEAEEMSIYQTIVADDLGVGGCSLNLTFAKSPLDLRFLFRLCGCKTWIEGERIRIQVKAAVVFVGRFYSGLLCLTG
ncbi:hypothetical protein L1987_60632 [Smallanthus sonchifolius]|uniref:Uncharacterized protein n=1 Tax=Smallanthus sonchifolius TaxID=185202 RepID=A0ACB9D8Z3_9ASTR|nr:hypothetical protein L1987_60632 [Smallanthus sonchifolius]